MRRLLNTLYVTNPDAFLKKKDDAIEVMVDGDKVLSVPFHVVDGIVLYGHASMSRVLMSVCANQGISIVFLDERGQYQGRLEGPVSGNVLLRREQYRRSFDSEATLEVARHFVVAKIHNSRVVLQHYARDYTELKSTEVPAVLHRLRVAGSEATSASTVDELRGIEGAAARLYFSVFGQLFRPDTGVAFDGRNRRPPTDPVNAALSLFYTMLARDVATACSSVGLDPQLGYLHACRSGRMSLALDLMEELRAPVVDRFVLSLFNRHQLEKKDFVIEGGGVAFRNNMLKNSLGWWQSKKKEEIVHPFLKERIPVGIIPFVQAQLFARYLRGDIESYPAMMWR